MRAASPALLRYEEDSTGNLRLALEESSAQGERENELLFIIAAQSMLAPVSLSLYLHDYTVVQYATLPLPYYHHASTVPTLVRPYFPFPFFIISYYLMTELP